MIPRISNAPYLAQSRLVNLTLTANGGASLSNVFSNTGFNNIYIKCGLGSVVSGSTLRISIHSQASNILYYCTGYCDTILTIASSRSTIITSLIGNQQASDRVAGTQPVLFGGAAIAANSINNLSAIGTNPLSINGMQLQTSSAPVFIPQSFQLLFQNMGSNNIVLATTEIYFG